MLVIWFRKKWVNSRQVSCWGTMWLSLGWGLPCIPYSSTRRVDIRRSNWEAGQTCGAAGSPTCTAIEVDACGLVFSERPPGDRSSVGQPRIRLERATALPLGSPSRGARRRPVNAYVGRQSPVKESSDDHFYMRQQLTPTPGSLPGMLTIPMRFLATIRKVLSFKPTQLFDAGAEQAASCTVRLSFESISGEGWSRLYAVEI